MASIARRIRRTYFLMSVCIIGVMITTVVLVNEDLEQTMLELEFVEERDAILGRHDQHEPLRFESTGLTALFVPDHRQGSEPVPPIFVGLSDEFSGEIELDSRTYLVNISPVGNGRFYIAKDITLFEKREDLFKGVLIFASLGILGLSLLLSVLSSRRLVKPLRQLAEHIHSTPVGRHMQRLPLNYHDAELLAIAETFNQFLDELQTFVKREQTLVSLASHELRTPVAVISGALDVLKQRQQLQKDDTATVSRIRQATQEMEQNVEVLLKLARRAEFKELRQDVSMPALIEEVLEGLPEQFNVHRRVELEIRHTFCLQTDPVVAKILIRNLLHNALQHTSGAVLVRLQPEQLEILDEGAGLTSSQRALLSQGVNAASDVTCLSGFGLYIASITSERLHWRLSVNQNADQGAAIQVLFETEDQ